ncbi:unnamed protein product [Rotaria sp. Silwood1]|nr:unnamed protein product [Rotaria sp. Silwood1]
MFNLPDNFPNLKFLRIKIPTISEFYIDGNILDERFTSKLSKLKKFEFDFIMRIPNRDTFSLDTHSATFKTADNVVCDLFERGFVRCYTIPYWKRTFDSGGHHNLNLVKTTRSTVMKESLEVSLYIYRNTKPLHYYSNASEISLQIIDEHFNDYSMIVPYLQEILDLTRLTHLHLIDLLFTSKTFETLLTFTPNLYSLKLKENHLKELISDQQTINRDRLSKMIRKLHLINPSDQETFHINLEMLHLIFPAYNEMLLKQLLVLLLPTMIKLTSLTLEFRSSQVGDLDQLLKFVNDLISRDRGYYEKVGRDKIKVWFFQQKM